jgi:DNA helicase IV/RNA helicase-like protein
MLTVETSRWAEFFGGRLTNTVFPKHITVSEEGIKTVKVRSLLVPWMREEETMPFGKIASVRHLKGIIWDTLVFETSGGSNNLDVDGLRKEDARKITRALNGRV